MNQLMQLGNQMISVGDRCGVIYRKWLGRDLLVWRLGLDATRRHPDFEAVVILEHPIWVRVISTPPRQLGIYDYPLYRSVWNVEIVAQWPQKLWHMPNPWIEGIPVRYDGGEVRRGDHRRAWQLPWSGPALPLISRFWENLEGVKKESL